MSRVLKVLINPGLVLLPDWSATYCGVDKPHDSTDIGFLLSSQSFLVCGIATCKGLVILPSSVEAHIWEVLFPDQNLGSVGQFVSDNVAVLLQSSALLVHQHMI